jgi:hypothetical protein
MSLRPNEPIREPHPERSFGDAHYARIAKDDGEPPRHIALEISLEMLVERSRFAADAVNSAGSHPVRMHPKEWHHGLQAIPGQARVRLLLPEKEHDATVVDHVEHERLGLPDGVERLACREPPSDRSLDWAQSGLPSRATHRQLAVGRSLAGPVCDYRSGSEGVPAVRPEVWHRLADELLDELPRRRAGGERPAAGRFAQAGAVDRAP